MTQDKVTVREIKEFLAYKKVHSSVDKSILESFEIVRQIKICIGILIASILFGITYVIMLK